MGYKTALLQQHKSDVVLTAGNEILCNTLNLCIPCGMKALFLSFFLICLTKAVNLLALSLFYAMNFLKRGFIEVIIPLIHPAPSVVWTLYVLHWSLRESRGVTTEE